MLGAIVGDIMGSVYEFHNIKRTDIPLIVTNSRFTDDSVLTLAIAKWLLEDEERTHKRCTECIVELAKAHPRAGYGRTFYERWLIYHDTTPYNSWGNGSAMRVSPVGLMAKNVDEAMRWAKTSAEVSHNHPEGIKGAQAIATAMVLAREGKSKAEIKQFIEDTFGYDLNRTCESIRPDYTFDVSCQGSVPVAIIAYLEGNSFEEVIRLAISVGGDSDTIGAMAGAIAQCSYTIPEEYVKACRDRLTPDMLKIMDDFENKLK
ncbi:MAG: ADP-ribosylglycohydrolase family protein [Paludibacteraceae bacterium]|nr:ADP-ribosylglycohydrolase family protein [Paludibacteraceae bacterium]